MSEKKPAHEVVVKAIRKTIDDLMNELDPRKIEILAGALAMALEILKRMILPEKDLGEVVAALAQIKARCSPKIAEAFLPEELFLEITQAPAKKNPIVEFLAQGKKLASEEGQELLKEMKLEVIKEAAAQEPILGMMLTTAMDAIMDPHLRRKILLALS